MLGKKTTDLLMEQINNELYSSYLYLKIANYYEDEALSGYANWFEVQAKEEIDHAMIIRKYLIDNNIKVTLDNIDASDVEFKNYGDPLVETLKHEKLITSQIYNILKTAIEENDYRTQNFIQWFVDEQFEEEVNAQENIDNYEMFAGCNGGLMKLNNKMGKREYSPEDADM